MKSKKRWIFLLKAFLVVLPVLASGQQLDGLGSQQAFSFRGNFSANLIGYNANGIVARGDPFSLMLSANATASFYGISMPFSFRFSNKRADYTQPFNQFGLSPSYKWAKAHIGYSSVNFSNYTMGGHKFLGGGLEMNPGKFRFGFVYGRFKKATTAFEQAIDTTSTLTRKGFATRIGVGSEKTFFDVIVLKIKDDSTTVLQPNGQYIPPEENLVTGFNTRIQLSENFSFESEMALSVYTTDVSAVPIENFDSLENRKIYKEAERFMAVNQSTDLLTAIRSSVNYTQKNFNTRLEYRRVDPGYRSMGTYYLNNDIENITIAPGLSLMNRKLNLRGSIGLQRDNLQNTKKATSLRTISSLNASFNPSHIFGIDLNYSNYASNQRAGRVPLIDSLKLFQTTHNLSIMPRLMFSGMNFNHMFMLMVGRMELKDFNVFTSQFTENQALLANFNYNFSLLQHGLSFLIGANYNELKNALVSSEAIGFTFGASKTFLEGKLMVGWNNSYIQTDQGSGKGRVINSMVNSTYQVARNHALRFNLYYISSSNPDGITTQKFNETKGDMTYVFTF